MRFTVIVEGRLVEGVIETDKEGIVEARIEDRVYRLDVVPVEPSVFWLKWGDRSVEVVVSGTGVSLGNRHFDVDVLDERAAALRRVRSASPANGAAGGLTEVRSPMPGKIVRRLVEPGESVEAGRGLVVMEAMKMQNEIRAPRAGTVKVIAVHEGARVASGDLLATLE